MTFDQIKRATAKRFGITVADLEGYSRRRHIVRPRMIAMMIARDWTGATFSEVGDAFSGRDHTTVMNAHERASDLISYPPPGQDYAADVHAILASVQAMDKRRKQWQFTSTRKLSETVN